MKCGICTTKAVPGRIREISKTRHHSTHEAWIKTVEWCSSFILHLPMAKLGSARLNPALIRPVHRGPTLNNIFPKLNNVKCLSLIDVSSWYHTLKLDDRSSNLTTFMCQFGRYRYKRLLFGAVHTCDMFQHKINEIFKYIQIVFGIEDDILAVGYDGDGKDHDETLWQILQICRNISKNKCRFRCTSAPLFGEVISRLGIQPNPQKLKEITDMPPPKIKRELQAFLGYY